jgi:hypothetical protein
MGKKIKKWESYNIKLDFSQFLIRYQTSDEFKFSPNLTELRNPSRSDYKFSQNKVSQIPLEQTKSKNYR